MQISSEIEASSSITNILFFTFISSPAQCGRAAFPIGRHAVPDCFQCITFFPGKCYRNVNLGLS